VDYPQKVRTYCGLYRGKACLSGVEFLESQNFPQIILRKGRLFHGKIHGKFLVFAHYPAERHAFPQDNSQKVKTSRVSYCGKHAFMQDNPPKVKTFRELSCEKFQYTAESENLTFLKAFLYFCR
jgi:hypothetical protein